MTRTAEFCTQLDTLPTRPGVYLMKDSAGKILYVGKAKDLRSRVRSYFQAAGVTERGHRIEVMVSRVADVDYIVTETEQEALILEANQIKAHHPRYNINLKDDKKYPFIRITNEAFPRIYWTRDVKRDGSRYLGPYSNARHMRTMLDVMHKIFPVRSCRYDLPDPKVKLCMEYQIRRCEGPCEGLVDAEHYCRSVSQAVRFLKGDKSGVIHELEAQMQETSKLLYFEQSARLRDQIRALELYQSHQKMVLEEKIDRDVMGMAQQDDEACCVVLEIREGRMSGEKHHFLGGIMEYDDAEIMSAFVRQFYLETDFVPRQIHLSVALDDADQIQEWLEAKRGSRVDLAVYQRGLKARTQDMAEANAANYLEERRLKREANKDRVPQSVLALQRDLALPEPPRHIEGVDISNFQGTDTVGSLVVMIDGKPRRSEYRHFRIRGVEGSDDFASIDEVVTRRCRGLRERGEAFPDLLMIDGGKGQLASALAALIRLGVDIPVVGIAKKLEELFLPSQPEAVVLPKTSASLRLLQVLRDEAHRFAINHHRKLRGKRTLTSSLDCIPGIGPKRRQALLNEFGSVRRLREADIEQIAGVKGFSIKLAHELKTHLQPAEETNSEPAS
ncbi:MAG: excinuclease ABC subunit UvrC [Candidatus Latescibacterota bacterium]|nr:excinuclease ABC subunit UvrC [Candidatus Latescibacterota bacterium]